MMVENTIMIPLSFDDDEEITIPSQKSKELQQFWLSLKPEKHKTIAHATDHIFHTFQLHQSCPLGIHLYVDGFQLLPDEKSGILSISDTISVRKNRNTTSVPLKESPERRRLKEGGDATSKKRKSSANLHGTNVRGDATTNQVRKSNQRKVQSSQVNVQKHEPKLKRKKRDDNNGKDKLKTRNMEISADMKRSDDIPNNANGALEGTVMTKKQSAEQTRSTSAQDQLNNKRKNEEREPVPVGIRPAGHLSFEPKDKVVTQGSRSARRKKIKRQRLKDLKKQWQQESRMHKIDGYALPPFESTGILKSSDMISVRKKRTVLSLEENLEGREAGVAQPVKAETLLLANHEFQEENGCYLSEGEYRESEDHETDKFVGKDQPMELEEGGIATSKKRKASANLHKSKKKKRHSALLDCVEDDTTANQVLKPSQDKVPSSQENTQKQPSQDKVPSSQENTQKQERNPKIKKQAKNGKDKITNSSMEISTRTESSDEIQINANDALEGPVETKKISRSSRRKKAKRQWLRQVNRAEKQNEIVQSGLSEILFAQLEEQTQPKSERKKRKGKRDDGELKGLLHWKSSAKDNSDDTRKSEEADQNDNVHEQANQHSNTEEEVVPAVVRPEHNQCNSQLSDTVDEVVPVVIRPGHIRFESLDKDEGMDQNNKSGEHFTQWNGITNKKKGQKWGKEKHGPSNSYRKDYYETQELDPEALTIEDQMEEMETEALIVQDQTKNVGAEVFRAHNELHLDHTVDFDKLPPLRNIPKASVVIVYRLLELSSSWTPELSPFRVGKVSRSSPETGKLLLLPVPEYPISSGISVDDDTDPQSDNSLYNEDGSLEIDFTALVDVRLLNDGSSDPTISMEQASDAAVVVPSASNDTQQNVSTINGKAQAQPGNSRNDSSTENGVVDIWEQVSAALNAKKAELSQERTGNTWSYRTLKGSALGPTMALLRSNKKL